MSQARVPVHGNGTGLPVHFVATGNALRVAFCIDNMNVGGTELNALRSVRHLRAAGVDLRVLSLSGEGPLLERYAELNVPVDLLPLTSLYNRGAFAAGRQMAAIVRRHGIQIVHAHDFYSNIFAAPWARLAGAAFIASRRWWAGPDRRSQRWANRASYLLAHRVVANSPSVAELLARSELVRRSHIVVVPNFLDDSAYQIAPQGWREALARELRLPDQRLVVGSVASLSPIKDHATLLRAVAGLVPEWPTLYLVLVGGDGGSRASLEGLARELDISDRVRFAGFRPNQPSAHHFFDVSALTSTSEGMPNSVLEAMACGRPVVATAVGAIPDAVVDGESGFLAKAGDAAKIRDLIRLLLSDPALAGRLGANGRERVRREYSSESAIGKLVETYHKLIPGTRSEGKR